MMKYLIPIFLLLSIAACDKPNTDSIAGVEFLELTALGAQKHQAIHNFGASDAWSCQFIGKNWPVDKKEQIADWLFSMERDANGNPMGIGLTAWRFNIGGGSAEQGAASDIDDEWRRAESFMTAQDTYDWGKQEGQRWFLQAAQNRGVETFIGFVNSPPVHLTKNGKAYSSNGQSWNLPPQHYEAFAEYLAEVAENLASREGITLSAISPFNEPQWDWTNSTQEGTPAQNSEIASAIRAINQSFEDRNLSTRIEIPETAQLNYLYEVDNKPGRGNQIEAFFDPQSPHYLGSLSHVSPKVAAHSYFTTWPTDEMANIRQRVGEAVAASPAPLEFWMTEYCPLENNNTINGDGRDLGMLTALYVARVIFSDLVLANASAWQWWLGVSPYDYKDGLVYTDYDKFNGDIYDSKTLWALGHFSRFVRPGMKRISVSRNDFRQAEATLESAMSTAFVSEDDSTFTMVVINYSENTIPMELQLDELPAYNNLRLYLTDALSGNNLADQGAFRAGDRYMIPPRSIVTITNQD